MRLAPEDPSSLTVAALKARLRDLGLPVSGKKAVLIERLQDAGGAAGPGDSLPAPAAAAAAAAAAAPSAAAAAAAAPVAVAPAAAGGREPGSGGPGEGPAPCSLRELEVGQTLEGRVVQIYCPAGVSVDVGCGETLGFLEVEEFQDGFPSEGPFSFQNGDAVAVRVLDVSPKAQVDFHGDRGEPLV